MNEIECIRDAERAAALLQPLRLRILEASSAPTSASRIAERLGEPRQKVNYHVRELARLRFLEPAGSRRKRNLVEQDYVARSRAFVLSPEILQTLGADHRSAADARSVAHLLALTGQVQRDLARATGEAADQRKRLPTWSLHAELRFASAEDRAAFARDVERAVADAVRRHAASDDDPQARPYRFIAGCHPIPPDTPETPEESSP